MARSATSVAFSVTENDLPRLERMVTTYARGNRSELLRLLMDRFETAERAARLRKLQAYGAAKSAERGIALEDVVNLVRDVRSTVSPPA